jgi:hypothetical protein
MTDHSAPDEPTTYQWSSHRNALDDWCPWSHVAVSARRATTDVHCPADCLDSTIEAPAPASATPNAPGTQADATIATA